MYALLSHVVRSTVAMVDILIFVWSGRWLVCTSRSCSATNPNNKTSTTTNSVCYWEGNYMQRRHRNCATSWTRWLTLAKASKLLSFLAWLTSSSLHLEVIGRTSSPTNEANSVSGHIEWGMTLESTEGCKWWDTPRLCEASNQRVQLVNTAISRRGWKVCGIWLVSWWALLVPTLSTIPNTTHSGPWKCPA